MANATTGWRSVAQPGNCGNRLFLTISGLADGLYYWSVQAVDNSFVGSAFAPEQTHYIGVGNDDATAAAQVPEIRIHPNPCRANADIQLTVKQEDKLCLSVYNLKGERVKRMFAGHLSKGTHSLRWNGQDESGRVLGNGVYLISLQAGAHTRTQKIVLIK